jgi:MOSC domain-containing protein YiiM
VALSGKAGIEMQLVSVNVGLTRAILNAKPSGKTGIYKQPVSGPVQITSAGLGGDAICDTEHHGGADQAVYVYGTPDYAWWSKILEHELSPGTFGENLTITELESAAACIGDRWHIGSVILEVTAPRVPCVTLAARMGDPTFVKRFREAERPGLYCRVIQEGHVQVGDPVTWERYPGETISAIELFRDFYAPRLDAAMLRRHLAAPIAVRDRIEKEAQLAKLLANHTGVSQP